MSAETSSIPDVPQPRSRVPIVIAWILILGLLALIVYANARSSASSVATQELMNDERARMFGMIVVQLKSLEKDAGTPSLAREQIRPLIRQLEEDAHTPEDQIRIAVLEGEAIGSEAALDRLESISGVRLESDAFKDIRSIDIVYRYGADNLDRDAREGLIHRHGYLGRLALAYKVPSDQEPRKTLQSEAFRFTLKLSLVGVGLVVLMGLSVAGFIAGCIWFFKGKIRKAYIRKTSSGGAFLEGFALYLFLFVALGVVLRYLRPASLHWTWLAILILPAVWMWVVLRRTTPEERRQAFGWYRGRGFFREVAAGLAGYVSGLVVVAAGVFVTLILVRWSGSRPSSPILQELNGGPWRVAGLYALACVFAPFMEETMFRGLLFHHLRGRWSWLGSAVTVSVIFALLHPQGWAAVPVLGSIAMVLATLREWRGSLIAPMAAHAFNNFLAVTLALLLLR
jgi:membrane protease YdiL (CAAX protease family)